MQFFLPSTSILEHLCASLCAAVTGASNQESANLPARLEQANLFLFPLDERGERSWVFPYSFVKIHQGSDFSGRLNMAFIERVNLTVSAKRLTWSARVMQMFRH